MLRGTSVHLRPVLETDLEALYAFHTDIENRGAYFPKGVLSQSAFRKQFYETGFWTKDEGMLLMVTSNSDIAGQIEFFHTVPYLDEIELSYQLYGEMHAGKGFTTEAVRLMVGYLFDRLPVNRIRLMIHPENAASGRVAEKCGFIREGTARGIWFHRGRSHDLDVYALLRAQYLDSAQH